MPREGPLARTGPTRQKPKRSSTLSTVSRRLSRWLTTVRDVAGERSSRVLLCPKEVHWAARACTAGIGEARVRPCQTPSDLPCDPRCRRRRDRARHHAMASATGGAAAQRSAAPRRAGRRPAMPPKAAALPSAARGWAPAGPCRPAPVTPGRADPHDAPAAKRRAPAVASAKSARSSRRSATSTRRIRGPLAVSAPKPHGPRRFHPLPPAAKQKTVQQVPSLGAWVRPQRFPAPLRRHGGLPTCPAGSLNADHHSRSGTRAGPRPHGPSVFFASRARGPGLREAGPLAAAGGRASGGRPPRASRRSSRVRAQVLGSASTSSGTMSHLPGGAAFRWLTHPVSVVREGAMPAKVSGKAPG